MAKVFIQESTLTDIANAIRTKKQVLYPTVKIFKTANATGFETFDRKTDWFPVDDGDSSDSYSETITFSGAKTIQIRMSYQTALHNGDDNWSYIRVKPGREGIDWERFVDEESKYPSQIFRNATSTIKYADVTINNSSVSINAEAWTEADTKGKLGCYAEITGYDASGNVIGTYGPSTDLIDPADFAAEILAIGGNN